MKKILFILLVLVSFPIFGQSYTSIDIATIVGTDTTLYLRNGKHNLLTIDFTTVNSNTSTLDIGHSDDRVSFVSASVSGVTFPITLSKVTYTKAANGYTRNRVMFSSDNWPGTLIAVKITKASSTAGVFKIWY